ncbi:Methyl-accepting chemotaxis protein McpA [Rubripirellula lacrimiformis]|uniref:Methyl-accepting chemotaxis protein McpA n=1 Tax=Rubripirellula lacrimiformis TaxID=1930273 RepID=A0A517NJ57_9BACT|nr:methyl-accepting chemotaxis protein [Rubripirellula lacrimiformis]QDT07170.1 Methyl-accepting chemotaxis protein McpA [Rubripirellula lacrimiformis]
MKTRTLLLATHVIATAVAATILVAAFQTESTPIIIAAVTISAATTMAISWYAATRIRTGLSVLEAVVSDNEASRNLVVGLAEFDQAATRIGSDAARWEGVAADTRSQAREFKAMMLMLNRRGTGNQPSSTQLRDLLTGLGSSLHSHLELIERSHSEIQQAAEAITDGSESQGHAIVKTTSYVEQLASTIDSVSVNATSAKNAIQSNGQSATTALRLVQQLDDGMNRVQKGFHSCEQKLRGLCDPSRQISEIVATITEITAKTDLLALNASIESIRAGELGSGFAIVAEEVRKLAEQTSDATREITSLIDSMQLVTQESIRGIENERSEIEMATENASAVKNALEEIHDATKRDATHVMQIATSSNQQLQIAQDVVLAVEQISKIAKANRGGADSIGWTIKTLANATPEFSGAIDRLRSCSTDSPPETGRSDDRPAPINALDIPNTTSGLASVC